MVPWGSGGNSSRSGKWQSLTRTSHVITLLPLQGTTQLCQRQHFLSLSASLCCWPEAVRECRSSNLWRRHRWSWRWPSHLWSSCSCTFLCPWRSAAWLSVCCRMCEDDVENHTSPPSPRWTRVTEGGSPVSSAAGNGRWHDKQSSSLWRAALL